MRWLNQHDRDDRGVVTIFVLGLIVILVVIAGFAIDIGRYVVESWSAQNSADATALAMAADCVSDGNLGADYSNYRKSEQVIDDDPSPSCDRDEVHVTVTKPVSAGLILKQNAHTIERSAAAAWKPVGVTTAKTLPITISNCEFSKARLDGDTDITLYLSDPKKTSGCSSLPGGFSQLAGDGCDVTVSTEGTVPGTPGGGELHRSIPCMTNLTPPALPRDVLVPIYDAAACEADPLCKGHGPYKILGFAMFTIKSYSFNGSFEDSAPGYANPLGKKCPDEAAFGKYCIRGDFIRFVSTPGPGPDPGSDFGAFQVYLSS